MRDKMEEQHRKFAARLNELKKQNTYDLTEEEYQGIIDHLDYLSQNPNAKKTTKDYRLINCYEVLEVRVDNLVVRKLKKRGTDLRFITTGEVFDAIHETHLLKGHGGRDITRNGLAVEYANVTRDQIQLYLDMCETCQLKKSKVQKSVVVKPIVSNNLNSHCQVTSYTVSSRK